MELTGFAIETLRIPCDPAISDSQTDDPHVAVAILTLETTDDHVGIGYEWISPAMGVDTIRQRVSGAWAKFEGSSPFQVLNRVRRGRGGAYPPSHFSGLEHALDIACWDLAGKSLDLPVWALLGGTDPSVRTYVSGLHYTLDDAETRDRYSAYAGAGFDAAKVKIGYPDVRADLDRIALVNEAMDDPILMLDANEAFDPKEAIRRATAYREAGYRIEWFEDPCLRTDLEGITRVAQALEQTHVNVGEYVHLEGKRQLLERGACELLNLRRGMFSESLDAAVLASAYGVPMHVGQAPFHVGIHLAAALPECDWLEYWPRPWDELLVTTLDIDDGMVTAPSDPGHGLYVSVDAIETYRKT